MVGAMLNCLAKIKQKWLQAFLKLLHGIPSHDTFGRVFARIQPEEFERSFMSWVKTIQEFTLGEIIAIDGKQLRGSRNQGEGQEAVDIVSAWANANELVLGEVKVDEKSNEITAIPKLLQLLDISGCLVTIDAIGTQTEIAEMIVDQGGDYLLAVKENQRQLYEDLETLFSGDQEQRFAHVAILMPEKWTIRMGAWRFENVGQFRMRNTWISQMLTSAGRDCQP
jgi:predicted transposase YbfD/YdcC